MSKSRITPPLALPMRNQQHWRHMQKPSWGPWVGSLPSASATILELILLGCCHLLNIHRDCWGTSLSYTVKGALKGSFVLRCIFSNRITRGPRSADTTSPCPSVWLHKSPTSIYSLTPSFCRCWDVTHTVSYSRYLHVGVCVGASRCKIKFFLSWKWPWGKPL